MSFLPGWDSLQTTGAIAHGLHVAALVVLVLLFLAEAAALIYDSRNHRLAEVAESQRIAAEQKNYDTESRHRAEVEALEQKLAKTAKAAIEAEAPQRRLTREQQQILASLSRFRGQKLSIQSVAGDGEGNIFKNDFVLVFERAGWDFRGRISEATLVPTPSGVQVAINEAEAKAGRAPQAAASLLETLLQAGIVGQKTMYMSSSVPMGEVRLIVGKSPHP
jgi:hypothetical protein